MMPHADDPRPSFRHVTILGVGLLGASLALAMRREGLADTIIGFGRRQAALEKARAENRALSTTSASMQQRHAAALTLSCSQRHPDRSRKSPAASLP